MILVFGLILSFQSSPVGLIVIARPLTALIAVIAVITSSTRLITILLG